MKKIFLITIALFLILFSACSEDEAEKPVMQVLTSDSQFFDSKSVYFGEISVGQVSIPKTFYIKNMGEEVLYIKQFTIEPHGNFSVSFDAMLPLELESGESKQIKIYFQPDMIGSHYSALIVENNSSNMPDYNLGLQGKGVY